MRRSYSRTFDVLLKCEEAAMVLAMSGEPINEPVAGRKTAYENVFSSRVKTKEFRFNR